MLRLDCLLMPIGHEWQQVLAVNRGTSGELSCNIEVAVGIGDGTDDVVPEFARRFLSEVGLYPIEVLGAWAVKGR